MEEEKKLYPFKFIHIDENPAEDVHLADLGYQDSLVQNGWLSANSISEIMDMYMDRVVGEHVFNYYGRQFPVSVKYLDGSARTPLLVHPDDEIAGQRFDFLGKAKLWYVASAKPGAKLFLGFKEDVAAEDFYMACRHGNVEDLLNVVEPSKGDYFFIRPGLVHAASEGLVVAEIAECSPLDFRIFNWGREFEGDEFDASLNLEAAFDFIDYRKYSGSKCAPAAGDKSPALRITDCSEFAVSLLKMRDPLHISGEQSDSFALYTCVSGEMSLQVKEGEGTVNYKVPAGESILVPAEVPDFYLVPVASDTAVLETVVEPRPEIDAYAGPDPDESPDEDAEDYNNHIDILS